MRPSQAYGLKEVPMFRRVLALFILVAAVVTVSLMPSKRSHQQ